jgi:hypothetical protein
MVGVVVVVRVNLGYSSAGIYTNRESEDTGFQGHKRRMHAPTQHGTCKIRMILVTVSYRFYEAVSRRTAVTS